MPSLRWALLSIGAACATVALQGLAYALTHSVGALASAAESLVNLAAAGALFIALWYGSYPPDETHAYGHEKIEYFSSGFEGALILIAAAGTIAGAAPRLLSPSPVEQLGLGALLIAVSGVLNLVVALALLREGRRQRSLALQADGHHLLTDVYTSAGVVVGLLVVAAIQEPRLDAAIGVALGIYILRTGIDLLRRSFHGLMDRALDPAELAALRAAIAAQLAPGMSYHDLRTRRVGPRHVADVHLLVPGDLTVRAGHDLATAVEEAVRAALPGAEITVHVEPAEGDRGPRHLPRQDLNAAAVYDSSPGAGGSASPPSATIPTPQ
jgi:cation diffusion facilitator family transporter